MLPIPARKHGVTECVLHGGTVDATCLQAATVPLNVTGLPGPSMRFRTSHDGLPINGQVVAVRQAESTILHLASLPEAVGPVRGLRPDLQVVACVEVGGEDRPSRRMTTAVTDIVCVRSMTRARRVFSAARSPRPWR